jgi:hypothetical protein
MIAEWRSPINVFVQDSSPCRRELETHTERTLSSWIAGDANLPHNHVGCTEIETSLGIQLSVLGLFSLLPVETTTMQSLQKNFASLGALTKLPPKPKSLPLKSLCSRATFKFSTPASGARSATTSGTAPKHSSPAINWGFQGLRVRPTAHSSGTRSARCGWIICSAMGRRAKLPTAGTLSYEYRNFHRQVPQGCPYNAAHLLLSCHMRFGNFLSHMAKELSRSVTLLQQYVHNMLYLVGVNSVAALTVGASTTVSAQRRLASGATIASHQRPLSRQRPRPSQRHPSDTSLIESSNFKVRISGGRIKEEGENAATSYFICILRCVSSEYFVNVLAQSA